MIKNQMTTKEIIVQFMNSVEHKAWKEEMNKRMFEIENRIDSKKGA